MVEKTDAITIEELAKLLRISVSTIYRYMRYGTPSKRNKGRSIDIEQIPFYYIGGKKFFSRSAVIELIEERKNNI